MFNQILPLLEDNAQDDKPKPVEQVTVAVVTVALTTLASGLVSWAVHELRTAFGSKPDKDAPKT